MDSKMPLYNKLKTLRAENKMTQKDVADYLHVSRQAISLWETGKTYPDIDNLVSLCKLYNISLDTLLGNETEAPITANNTDQLIKHLIAAILSTILSQFAVIGIIIPIIIFLFCRKEKRSFSIFDIYILITLISGIIHTYFFLF